MIDDIFNTAMHCGLCGNKKLVVLVILYDEIERGVKCTASCAQIAQMCGVELRTVSRLVKQLRDKGILSSEDTNGYTFKWTVHVEALPAPIAVADVLARVGSSFQRRFTGRLLSVMEKSARSRPAPLRSDFALITSYLDQWGAMMIYRISIFCVAGTIRSRPNGHGMSSSRSFFRRQ